MYLSINGRVRKYSNAGYSSVGGVIHCAVQYIIMIHCAGVAPARPNYISVLEEC